MRFCAPIRGAPDMMGAVVWQLVSASTRGRVLNAAVEVDGRYGSGEYWRCGGELGGCVIWIGDHVGLYVAFVIVVFCAQCRDMWATAANG